MKSEYLLALVSAWAGFILLSGCDTGCPRGYERDGDACVLAPRDAATSQREEGVGSKPDAAPADAAVGGDTGGRVSTKMPDAVDGDRDQAGEPAQPEAGRSAADGGVRQGPDVAGQQAEAGHAAGAGGAGTISQAPPGPPSFVSQGGAVLRHPDIVLLFWGAAWTASSAVTPGQIAGALQHMLAGPYFANLNQYGQVTYPVLNWVSVDSSTAVPNRAPSAAEVAAYINTRLDVNAAPALGGEQLFVVVLPPGVEPSGALGERGRASYKDGASYRYAWAASSESINDARSATYAIARHIIHTMTNPDGNGWVDAISGKELSDVCGWTSISGVAHPQYWSNADGRCVVPREYGSLLRYDGAPNAWTSVSSRVRMAACGGYGLVATDATDNLFKYNGQPNDWVQIGLPGAQHVVGVDTVYGLSPDLAGLFRYSGTGSDWARIGNQYVNMFAGGFGMFATELGSNRLKKWIEQDNTWTDFGEPGSSFAVGADFIAGVSPNHAGVFRASVSTGWTNIQNTGINQLYASGRSSQLAATDRSDPESIYLYKEGLSWARQGDPGYAFALTTEDLFGMTPSRWAIFQSGDLSATSPPWTQISGEFHNLVGGCDTGQYALSGLVQCDEGVTGTAGSACTATIGP